MGAPANLPTPTLGEIRVGRNFNPSANSEVEFLKSRFAELIDCCESMKHSGNVRELSKAQTELETACMYAVKAQFLPKSQPIPDLYASRANVSPADGSQA